MLPIIRAVAIHEPIKPPPITPTFVICRGLSPESVIPSTRISKN